MSTCANCCHWKQAPKYFHSTDVPGFGVCDRVGWYTGMYPYGMRDDLFAIEAQADDDSGLSVALRTKAEFGCNQHEAVK
jgi:hypothetical protein